MQCPIKTMRKIKRHTQDDVARYLRVSPSTVWRWEHNEMMPTPENFLYIAEYLELSVERAIRLWVEWSKRDKGESVEEFLMRLEG